MLNRHHRKPRSRGGTNDHTNISIVDSEKHKSYHTMFGNMTTKEIVHELNTKYLHGMSEELPEFKQKAFNILFSGMTVSEIVRHLNEIWIDPDDTIKIVRKPFIQLYGDIDY